ncbi:MAG: hypothetical protein KDB11_21420 [Planctomycetales bacterium]|nr:hypothetical protein [Planctomycetales bacterium]
MNWRLITAVVILLQSAAGKAQELPSATGFEHIPIMYQGPDPTANYFLPLADGFDSQLSRLPSPSAQIPELLPAPAETFVDYADPQQFSIEDVPGTIGRVTEFKDGFFQKACFTGAFIDRGSANSFGVNELDASLTVAVPLPKREWPLLITPTFNVRYLDGPIAPSLPPRLYEAYVDFLWVPRLNDRWTAIIGVAPSMYTDFEVSTSDAFRFTGKALARYDWVPGKLQMVFGVLYLNRHNVKVLPAGGFIWDPSVDQHYELIFPRPRFSHRIDVGPGYEDWVYLGAEFGGNSFAYDQGGVADIVTLLDYRVLLGLERKFNGGAGYRIEVGYVFSRTAKFNSALPDINADNTALVRAGLTY